MRFSLPMMWLLLDLRIDNHPDPLSELARLEQIAQSA
jgi:uncharacterized Ntn-hydrolase superfamily protein